MKHDGENMNKEHRMRTSRCRSAEDLGRQLVYELAEQALESQVKQGLVEKFFCPEDGQMHYRLRQRGGAQEASCTPAETRKDQIDAAKRREE